MIEPLLAPWRVREFRLNILWWTLFMGLQVLFHVMLSSLGAFFHFLLNHPIALVEGWLHNNGWELVVVAKFAAVGAVYWFLNLKLYRPLKIKAFLIEKKHPIEERVLIVCAFIFITLLVWGAPHYLPDNRTYVSYQLIAYTGLTAWFMADYVAAALLQELFPTEHLWMKTLAYLVIYRLCFGMMIPNYFGMGVIVHLHFFMMLMLAGPQFEKWKNVLAYALIVAGPAATVLGLDPIWGSDFSVFKLEHMPSVSFLLPVWMLSLVYYRYRHLWPLSTN